MPVLPTLTNPYIPGTSQHTQWEEMNALAAAVESHLIAKKMPGQNAKMEEVIEHFKGVRRSMIRYGKPPSDFKQCQLCMYHYEEKGVLAWNEGKQGALVVCKFCFPKAATCRFCQHQVLPEQFRPGEYVQQYCPQCGPPKGKLEVKQDPNFKADVEILKKRTGGTSLCQSSYWGPTQK